MRCVFCCPVTEGCVVSCVVKLLKVKSIQRSGTEAIRTQLQPSKLKRCPVTATVVMSCVVLSPQLVFVLWCPVTEAFVVLSCH